MTGIFRTKEKSIARVVAVETGLIVPNRSQPRKEFDEGELSALAASIKENGILQPINVRRSGVNYEIISGERRFRAAKICGLSEVPCIIIDADDEKSAVLSLIENIQRRDLSYFEEALAIERLIKYYGLTQEEAAKQLGKAQSTIANKLRLLRFSDAERNLLVKGNVSERQARALIRIDDEKMRIHAMGYMIINKLNTQQTEDMVEGIFHGIIPKKAEPKTNKSPNKQECFHFPLPRLYINSINKIVKNMKEANIDCETELARVGDCYEYKIKIHSTSLD